MPRLFISIDLPEEVKDQISDLYCAIKGAKWTDTEQLHLTLRFIGETDCQTEDRIIGSLSEIHFEPFPMKIKGIGYFPPRKEPRILWTGIEENKNLTDLQARIERALVHLDIEPDLRRFHPHITIARLDNPHQERVVNLITENNLFCSEQFEVSEFHLYRSYLGKTGAHHVLEASFGV